MIPFLGATQRIKELALCKVYNLFLLSVSKLHIISNEEGTGKSF